MKDEQKLYPQLIYRINSKLSEVKIASGIDKEHGNDKQIIAPSVFNPYGRNFHWLVVEGDKWEFPKSNNGWFGNIKNHISNKSDQWKKFKEKYHGSKDKIEIKSIEESFNLLDIIAAKNKDEYHHALLTAFQFYPVSSHKYIDGIIYRNLVRRADYRSDKSLSKHKIDYAIAELLIDEDKTATYKLYPWARVDFHGGMPETKYSCQEDNSPWYPDVLPDIETDSIPPIKDKGYYLHNRSGQFSDDQKFPLTPADKIEDSFYYNYFLPFFAGYQEFKTDKFLELKPEYFKHFKHIIIAPLYDAYIDGKYYGNLCGTLQIPFKAEEEKNQKEPKEPKELTEFKQNNLKKLISSSHLLTREIKESAIFEVLQQQIGDNTDLLEHFIKYITLVQDWEKIMVWEYEKPSDLILNYCYKRDKENKWDRCEEVDNGTKCKTCKPNFDALKGWIQHAKNKHLPIAEKNYGNKNAKRKAVLEKIFNKKLIPELYDDIIVDHKNTHLIFEYPCYTVFPKNEKDDHKLGLHYERQQIDILRQMAMQLKVKRETVKHGTKSALLSIDVRNLSHNIGSHVLAYWIQELNQLLDNKSTNDDLRIALYKSKAMFRYIQHRADFLAEVATSIPCSEMSFDLKKEILNPFLKDNSSDNPYKDAPQFNKNEPNDGLKLDSNIYVLLRYIAESEGISINFDAANKSTKNITYEIDNLLKENGTEKAVYVSIPSGIIGKHAIYSILENFIRNAAKHYKGTGITANGDFIKIKVSKPETQEGWKDDYVAVEIIDVRVNSCNYEVVQKLNRFINGSFVNEDGSLKPGGWGIKEMLISANFFRKNTPEYLYDVIIGNITCNPPLLEIICKSNNKNEACDNKNCCKECKTDNHLAIRFYLKKPKHLAVMVGNITEEMIKKDVFEIKKITGDDFKGPIPHNILLVDQGTYNCKYKDQDDPLAPCRIMSYDEAIGKGKDKTIDDNCYLCLYKKFIKDEIWRKDFPLPILYNSIGGGSSFIKTDLSLNSLDGVRLDKIISFINHPEAENSKEMAESHFDSCCFFQPISGGFSTKSKFANAKDLQVSVRYNFYLELIEAALTKVVIVDERISEWADKLSKYNFNNAYKTQREMLAKMNIYVAKIEKENVSNLAEKLKKEELGCSVLHNENRTKDKNTAHFFVIHQGILDKLDDKCFMNEIKCRWKVIDSGRGVPEKMEHRFVQISALQTLLENYDKHGLVQTLFSLRKPKPVKEEQSGNQS